MNGRKIFDNILCDCWTYIYI